MDSSRPSAQRIHQEIRFLSRLWKANKPHFVVVVVLLLFAGWAVVSQAFTIPGLRSELTKRDAEIQHLEQQLLPFQTAAVAKFSGLTEDEALAKFAARLGK
jgi:hypothetical protein